jgi:hypothetical protein
MLKLFVCHSYSLTELVNLASMFIFIMLAGRLFGRLTEAMGDKLVMHSRGSMVSMVQYNIYVVNGKLFRTIAHDVRKKS